MNFFQPSVKLLKKTRTGAKVAKQYDKALTPYQRVLNSPHVSQAVKDDLSAIYMALDPVTLMSRLQELQADLMGFAWNINGTAEQDRQNIVLTGSYPVHVEPKETVALTYLRFEKPRDKRSLPRTWRTRKDQFAHAWDDIKFKLQLEPHCVAKDIFLPCVYVIRHIRLN